jgi:3D-(3,5/4)-trihydroxycyclohexane-1,2-dione acylhydrolase (decyclizing)
VIEVASRDELKKAIRQAKEAPGDAGPILIHVQTDPLVHAPDSESWWDVPVSEVAELASTTEAYDRYLAHQAGQKTFLAPTTTNPSEGES